MILDKYILKETVKMQVVFFIILNAVFLCQSFIQVLRSASKGDIPAQLITEMLLLSIPNMSVLMIPLTIYLGILVAHARLGADSEFVVMKSLGVTPLKIIKGALLLGIVTMLIALVNSLYLVPMAQAKQEALLQDAKENSSYFAIDSGKFIRLNENKLVAYIDDVNNEKNNHTNKKDLRKMDNIYLFMQKQTDSNKPNSIGYAQQGYVTQDEDGVMWLVLEDGTFYIGPNDKNQHTKMNFQEYKTLLSEKQDDDVEAKINSIPTLKLISMDSPVAQAEMQWRICSALCIPLLTLIVVPLANVKPRQGKFAKFLPALLIYGSMFMFMVAIKHLIGKGIFPAFPGIFSVLIVYLLIFGIPFNITETRWFRRYLQNNIRKKSLTMETKK